tara:strand:- start:1081 stop:1767 length:687 start_codon:yes stop_codon:yes gene_type:complete
MDFSLPSKNTAFLIPSTSRNRQWNIIEDSYLYQSLSILDKHYKGISVYVGVDKDDEFYKNNIEELKQKLNNLIFQVYFEDYEKGNVVSIWNHLSHIAYDDGMELFFAIGDDIVYPDNKEWLQTMCKKLRDHNGIGFSAGDSGNPQLPMTQFLISRKHIEIFGNIFNPLLKNWFCDNYLCELYPNKYIYYFPEIKLLNNGGQPRYKPEDHRKLYKMLVKRDKFKSRKSF